MLRAVVAGVVVATVPTVLPDLTVSPPMAATLQIRLLAVPITVFAGSRLLDLAGALLARPAAADVRRMMPAIGHLSHGGVVSDHRGRRRGVDDPGGGWR
jgi:hypothetical protein